MARDFNYEAHAVFFDVPTEICMERNRKRSRNVPDDIMIRMAQKLRPPKFDEGFSKITIVRAEETGRRAAARRPRAVAAGRVAKTLDPDVETCTIVKSKGRSDPAFFYCPGNLESHGDVSRRIVEGERCVMKIPTWRLVVMRLMYLILVVGLVLDQWVPLLRRGMHWDLWHGVGSSLLCAIGAMALLGCAIRSRWFHC